MRPHQSLPIGDSWSSTDEYVDSLLTFVSTSELFRNLCGGVHVLDFLTRKPDLYSWILPSEWRDWFEGVNIEDILDLLLREDLAHLSTNNEADSWRRYNRPPESLVQYIKSIRSYNLDRKHQPRNTKGRQDLEALPKHVAVGMKPKKIHEVAQFANFVDDLSEHLTNPQQGQGTTTTPKESDVLEPVVVDFGSGQNYLGRTLACPPYNKRVMAIEQRHHNVEGAKGMDVSAKLATKEKKIVNKKAFKAQWIASRSSSAQTPTEGEEQTAASTEIIEEILNELENRVPLQFDTAAHDIIPNDSETSKTPVPQLSNGSYEFHTGHDDSTQSPQDSIQYIEKSLCSGDLNDLMSSNSNPSLVVSIHSCGNLTHHGLRSLTLNPSVEAVALIGCCYNLLTERLGPPTYKLPSLRSNHPRLEATSSAFDPHGFPMSKKLEEFTYPVKPVVTSTDGGRRVYHLNGDLQDLDVTGKGVRLNITARMMAVQAPHNWGPKDSQDFFTRHYYRALLQRILLDLDVVKMARSDAKDDVEIAGGTLSGKDDSGSPLIIGSLKKACFVSFKAYVTGAISKLVQNPEDGPAIKAKTDCLFDRDGELIQKYEDDYWFAKKHLSVIWSLMAFSAGVVESVILVDRWLWLKEQEEVEDAWVEAVFDYKQSPRNMVVVGIKRKPLSNAQRGPSVPLLNKIGI